MQAWAAWQEHDGSGVGCLAGQAGPREWAARRHDMMDHESGLLGGNMMDHGSGLLDHESGLHGGSRLDHGSGLLSVWHTWVRGLGSARQRIGLALGLE